MTTQAKNAATATFQASLRGSLIQPGDALYDESRKVYNAMIDKRPALITRCADVADVVQAVNFARDNALTLAVHGGGHNGGGLGTCDDRLVIDLSPMNGVRVDPGAKTASGSRAVRPGARLTTRPTPTVWQCRAVSSLQWASAGSRWAAVWGT